MFYSTLCWKMGVYFQNVFELDTTEHKLLWFTMRHLEADTGDCVSDILHHGKCIYFHQKFCTNVCFTQIYVSVRVAG